MRDEIFAQYQEMCARIQFWIEKGETTKDEVMSYLEEDLQ
jgi:hypothetical protein